MLFLLFQEESSALVSGSLKFLPIRVLSARDFKLFVVSSHTPCYVRYQQSVYSLHHSTYYIVILLSIGKAFNDIIISYFLGLWFSTLLLHTTCLTKISASYFAMYCMPGKCLLQFILVFHGLIWPAYVYLLC